MKKAIVKSLLIVGITVTMVSFDLPKGWIKAGDKPESYEMGIDKGAGHDGKNAATIKSIDKKISGFGTLMQQCSPNKYLGKRVHISGYMKSKDVDGWAGFWFRVDPSLAFDNMQDRSIKGTTDWKKYDITLDVPDKATNLAYGALLAGTGQIWFDNITFEVVGNSVSTTGHTLEEPTNLNFEK